MRWRPRPTWRAPAAPPTTASASSPTSGAALPPASTSGVRPSPAHLEMGLKSFACMLCPLHVLLGHLSPLGQTWLRILSEADVLLKHVCCENTEYPWCCVIELAVLQLDNSCGRLWLAKVP